MIIRMERSGGFTGIPLRTVIDTGQLSAEEGRTLQDLVDSAGFFDLPASLPSPRKGADRFNFRLTVEEPGRSHTVEFGDAAASEPLQALIQQVTLLARTNRQG